MKFHYAKYLVGSLIIAFLIWGFSITLGIDPLTLARSQNSNLGEYLSEAKALIEKNTSAGGEVTSASLRDIDQHLAAAQIVVGDQKKSLEQLANERSGPNLGSVQTLIASLVAIVGTFSTVILSWRKDIREARGELEKVKIEKPKIVIP